MTLKWQRQCLAWEVMEVLNKIYRLAGVKRFEACFQDNAVANDTVVVRPDFLSICKADQRYYQGKRPAETMRRKLPMALVHEGTGHVVYSASGKIKEGQHVVMVPNVPGKDDGITAENYRSDSLFCSSSCDGYTQELVYIPEERILVLPEILDSGVASFTELVSVGFHAVKRLIKFSHPRKSHIAVWGDGNLGYITTLLIKKMLPGTYVTVCGASEEKLDRFTFADQVLLADSITGGFQADHAVECVGGVYAEDAIRQIIQYICPEGTVALMGVSEFPPKINTRMVLEKGLRIFGSSRSGREDFEGVLNMYKEDSSIPAYLASLVSNTIEVNDVAGITDAFEEDAKTQMGKTVIRWRA